MAGLNAVTPDEFVARFPLLWHLCASDNPDAAWDDIKREGLLSVEAMADAAGLNGRHRASLLREHRPQPVRVGTRVVRDTRPMPPGMLRHVVIGESPEDWRERLNALVFLHPGSGGRSRDRTPERHITLWRRYAAQDRLVLVIDSARLVASRSDIQLAPLNTGAARMVTHTRGPTTIRPMAAWPAGRAVAEVALPYAITDVQELCEWVVVRRPDGTVRPVS